MDRELEAILAIVRRAQAVVLEVYASSFEVSYKSPGDPVTEADRRANDLLCEALGHAFPGEPILAEESAEQSPLALRALPDAERAFFVDPVDGTREFVAKNGEFSIMVGLAEGGKAHLGVLLMPTTGEAVAARVGGEAFVEDAAGARRPLGVSRLAEAARARLLMSRSHRSKRVLAIAAALGITELVPSGSVGVKVARLARGDGDLYVHTGGGIKLWDVCAPEAVLRAAGGAMTDLDGQPFSYAADQAGLSRGLVASNGLLHEPALRAIRELGF